MEENNETIVKDIPEIGNLLKNNGHSNEKCNKKTRDTLYLYFTLITANLLVLSGAASTTWASPTILKLLSNDTNINPLGAPITPSQISVITGLPFMFSLGGWILFPFLSNVLGRKKLLHCSGLLMLISIIIVAFSTKIPYIASARTISCFCFTGCMSVLPVFISEMCENHNRAKFGCIFTAHLPIGSLYAYIFGPRFGYKMFTIITAIPLMLFSVLFFYASETPVYLLSKGRREKCRIAIHTLRSNKNTKELQVDLIEIEEILKAGKVIKKPGIFSIFEAKENRIGLFFTILVLFIQYGCGVPSIMIFITPTFAKLDTTISADTIAFIAGLAQVLGAIIPSIIVEKTGRRFLLIISSIGCGINLFIVGTCFYIKQSSISWIPIVSIVIGIFMYATGAGPVPGGLSGELFIPEVRTSAMILVGIISGLYLTIFHSGFPLLEQLAGPHWCFWIASLNSFFGCFCVYFLLPETRGMSILEIQNLLKNYRFGLQKF